MENNYPIKNFHIKNYRAIVDETFEFRPLTVFTGKNGIGKSSVLNALLSCSDFDRFQVYTTDKNLTLDSDECEFVVNENCENERKFIIDYIDKNFQDKPKQERERRKPTQPPIKFDINFYHLKADRTPIEPVKRVIPKSDKFGILGEFVEQYYCFNARNEISNFKKEVVGQTLDLNVKWWISRILDLNFSFKTKQDGVLILSKFQWHDFEAELEPNSVATGLNYLTKILVVGLSCKKGDVFVVENPEIHLHPKAVANLTEFFSFLASNGVQCVVETHSEAFVTQFRLRVLKRELDRKDVVFYDKNKQNDKFEKIDINSSGYFTRENGRDYSSEFFSANDELWELV